MEQVLFIFRSGKISQWNLLRGKLVAVTVRGQHKVPYSAETSKAYWDEWKEDNMVAEGDVYDAIFLSDTPDGFGKLPKWICTVSKEKSAWTIEQLSLLAGEAVYKEAGLCLVQGKVKWLIGTKNADDSIKLFLKSALEFTLPKEVTKPKTPEPSKKSAAAEKAASGEAQINPPSNMFTGDSCNDPKALLLKVGDKITCTVTSVRPMRGFCYLKTEKTSELIRVKLEPINKTLTAKSSIIKDRLLAEVISVNDQVVEYKITI